jgi:hypothetical protein
MPGRVPATTLQTGMRKGRPGTMPGRPLVNFATSASAAQSSIDPSSALPSVKNGAILLSNIDSAEPMAMCMSRYL